MYTLRLTDTTHTDHPTIIVTVDRYAGAPDGWILWNVTDARTGDDAASVDPRHWSGIDETVISHDWALEVLPASGDRVYTTDGIGTIQRIDHVERAYRHGVTGDRYPSAVWYRVKLDTGDTNSFDDAGGDWDMARMMPLDMARRAGLVARDAR